ncbi:hypothetical protein FOH10_29485 [Nocardia otitidiscaviarum]|uniref:Type IV secretory pathway, VirD4 components n=1 Tax=Nocardia otitidiscaviarum TaxID=1823 RepID=A0A516NTM3_9NOCA|nr:hypothetical protein [Nocardia otitidiscaviarum]MCP9621586.1 hypothetical protein [Nocardia otitidiscaviarum]QDP82252.1 hypothetical protein FOH10_29485 [Nocardia otitidiscaviarum]
MSNCTPLITPQDCGPVDPPVIFDISPTTPAPPTSGFDQIGPQAPPGIPEVVPAGWQAPDLSQLTHVAGVSLVAGVVVVAMLIMIMTVAASWPLTPHRLRNFAIAALGLPVLSALTSGSWSTPASLFWAGAEQIAAGNLAGLRMMLALGAPVAMLAATYWWARFVLKTNTVGLKSLGRTERVQDALEARRFRAAARAAKLGAPYSAGASIVLGTLADRTTSQPPGLWRELTDRHQHWLTVPHKEIRRHRVTVATTGGGKTELQKRDATAVFDYEWRAWQQWKDVPGMRNRHPRPQMVMIACKGGEDDRDLGLEMRAVMTTLGIDPARIALVMPGGDRLDIWNNMPARDLRAIIGDLLNAGEATTSEGQHFDDMRTRIVSLVINAPIGPPRNSTEFLARLNPQTLKDIWSNAPDVVRQVDALQAEKVPQIDDALIKCSNLFELLKDQNGDVVFDGGKNIDDLDVLFMTVPDLDKDAARAQVAATLRMVMQRAGRAAKHRRRSVTINLDEASALTTKKGSLGLVEIAERGRSKGVALNFSGQSPESLAPDAWMLNRLLKSCAGGVLIGYCENGGDLCKHVGSVRAILPSRHLIKGQRTGDEGQVSVGERWLVDPDRVRRFATGEFVYAKAGRAWFGRIVPVDLTDLSPLPGTPAAEALRRDHTAATPGDPATSAA